jgi:hypothetical protein
MKKLQQISMAVVLTLMLATGAFAGIIHTPGPPPPPDSATALHSSSATESGTSDQQTSENSLGSVALNLLQTLLSVF